MKKMNKTMFGTSPASIRRLIAALDAHPAPKFRMDHSVPKPSFVIRSDGSRVRYDGPQIQEKDMRDVMDGLVGVEEIQGTGDI